MAALADEERDWYTVDEVSRRFGKTPQAVRVAADRNRLVHDVVLRGSRKERRFPKAIIDALDRWPGYGARPLSGSPDALAQAELERQRELNARLQREVADLRAGRAAAEMRIDELVRVVDRQRRALVGLVDAITEDEVEVGTLRELLR
ncbi:MAG: hypothetical protein ACRD12_04485 [Acidimicrobiales bacterium]